MRRIIAVAVGVAAFAIPGVASAHTPNVADNCQGLNVQLTNYEGGSSNNQVTVTIDGGTQTFTFGSSFTKSFGWSTSSSHAWSVVIDANRLNGNATQYDKTFNGTEQPCQPTPTTTAPTSSTTTTTTPASTTTTPTPTTTPGSTTTTSPPSTTLPDTTTSTVEVGEPPIPSSIPPTPQIDPPTPAPASPANQTLPVTGDNSERIAWTALAAGCLGLFLTLVARRRPT